MAERTCVVCGEPIEKPDGRCPKTCEAHRPVRWGRKIGPRLSTCDIPDCHNLLPPGRGPRRWCSAICNAQMEAERKRAKPTYFPRRPVDYATCVYCSKLFVVRRRAKPSDTVCRSSDCRAEKSRRAQRDLRVVRKAAGRPLGRSSPEAIDRRRAANSERRAKTRGAQRIDRFSPDEIFERDDWRCGVCGRKTSKKPWPHPKSATLDHVVPLIEGGEHTKANSRCAHLSCNSSRRDRGGDEQLRLIG